MAIDVDHTITHELTVHELTIIYDEAGRVHKAEADHFPTIWLCLAAKMLKANQQICYPQWRESGPDETKCLEPVKCLRILGR